MTEFTNNDGDTQVAWGGGLGGDSVFLCLGGGGGWQGSESKADSSGSKKERQVKEDYIFFVKMNTEHFVKRKRQQDRMGAKRAKSKKS